MMMLMSLSRKAKEIYLYEGYNRKEKITHTRKICVKKKFHPEMKSNRLKHVRMWVEPRCLLFFLANQKRKTAINIFVTD